MEQGPAVVGEGGGGVGAGLPQQPHRGQVPRPRRHLQAAPPVLVTDAEVGPGLHQRADRGLVICAGGGQHHRGPVRALQAVNSCARPEQLPHSCQLAALRGLVQRRLELEVPGVHAEAEAEQQLDAGHVSAACRHVQQPVPGLVVDNVGEEERGGGCEVLGQSFLQS